MARLGNCCDLSISTEPLCKLANCPFQEGEVDITRSEVRTVAPFPSTEHDKDSLYYTLWDMSEKGGLQNYVQPEVQITAQIEIQWNETQGRGITEGPLEQKDGETEELSIGYGQQL